MRRWWSELTWFARGLILMIPVGIICFGAWQFKQSHPKWFQHVEVAAKVPEQIKIARQHINQGDPGDYQLTALPVANDGTCPTVVELPWNAIGALNYANGGSRTKQDSLISKFTGGGCLQIARLDSYDDIHAKLVADKHNPNGVHFAVIMGDGYPYFALGDENTLPGGFKAIAALGFSYGEDKCMLPPSVKADPQKARGMTVAASKLDGDWNVCVKWASDNGVPINSDTTVHENHALNFMDTGSFSEADEKFNSNATEERDEANNGVKTGAHLTYHIDGIATWFPGDDIIVHGRGGVVTVASTKDYESQMPALLIGDVDWMNKHHDFVVGMLKAADRAANAIRTDDQAFQGMAVANADIFGKSSGVAKERTPDYWAKAFPGYVDTDSAGNSVTIGGSEVINLREQANYFGLVPGSYNIFKGDYDTFGKYDHIFYPKDVPSVPTYDSVMDMTYLQDALSGIDLGGQTNHRFAESKPITETVSQAPIYVEFDSGQDTIRPESYATLSDVANKVAITGLRARFIGYTDDRGSDTVNVPLSRRRAQAVINYLNHLAPTTFPKGRFQANGKGSADPIASNATEEGRKQNRRVQVVLGN